MPSSARLHIRTPCSRRGSRVLSAPVPRSRMPSPARSSLGSCTPNSRRGRSVRARRASRRTPCGRGRSRALHRRRRCRQSPSSALYARLSRKCRAAPGGAGAVWCRLAAGCVERAPVIGGHGVAWCAFAAGCVMAAVWCRARVQRRARWLAFLLREKFLDKLCKSILDWKWGKGPGPFTTGTAVRRSRRYPALPAQRSAARPRCRRGWRPRQRR